jgi:hypothetical protein
MGAVMEFHWGETDGAQFGYGRDDHSIKPPQLVCRTPYVSGSCIAEQWYQYSFDGQNWINLPGAAYLIHKGIRLSKGRLFSFSRRQIGRLTIPKGLILMPNTHWTAL